VRRLTLLLLLPLLLVDVFNVPPLDGGMEAAFTFDLDTTVETEAKRGGGGGGGGFDRAADWAFENVAGAGAGAGDFERELTTTIDPGRDGVLPRRTRAE